MKEQVRGTVCFLQVSGGSQRGSARLGSGFRVTSTAPTKGDSPNEGQAVTEGIRCSSSLGRKKITAEVFPSILFYEERELTHHPL